jgi:hypothetical protein
VIGLSPSFAVLIRVTRKSSKTGAYVKQEGASFSLKTIGRISTRSKNKTQTTIQTDTFWTDVHDSQEELAGKHDGLRASTTTQHQPESSGSAK